MSVTLTRKPMTIPTYEPKEPNTLPFFLENKPYQGATGRLYPLAFTDRLTNTPVDRDYDSVTLENEYIKTILLPELGGKIHGAVDKATGYEFIYQNTVIKPALVGLAGPWVSGGVEFNWPQHHRPTTFMPLDCATRENPDGSKTCIMGEDEPFNRMHGEVAVTVYPGSSIVEATATVCNRADRPLPFMWWNNLAVRVHKKYKAVFPPDVEWGNDHDRRAVISFPVMKGIYHTARPFDYGEGTDVTWYPNVKLPTSVMVSRGQSDMDFLAGYDFAADEGTVTVSDHHYSVGKKMWTWGDGDFGHAWCANLTDNGDRYIELMTGVFTDNQPDFTYIMPGETKIFTQVWYPVRGIGEVKNASRGGAVSLEVEGNKIKFGAVSTERHENASLRLFYKENLVVEKRGEISPDRFWMAEAEIGSPVLTDLRVEFAAEKPIVSYKPTEKGQKKPPEARPIPPRPKDVGRLEDLVLHASHLTQYKHHTYKPEDYLAEALRREPEDLRANHLMGLIFTERGEYEKAAFHLEKAVERLKLRNDNPSDTQPVYDLARLEKLRGNVDRAYDLFYDASWQYPTRSASYFELARIDASRGDYEKAVGELKLCLETNSKHLGALTMLGYLDDPKYLDVALEIAPLDPTARFADYLKNRTEIIRFIENRPEDVLDAALDFEKFGLISEAVKILESCKKPSQLIFCHLSRLDNRPLLTTDLTFCHPNRLDDIPALQGGDWRSEYLLGCLYYDRMNYDAARKAWEKSDSLHPFAPTKRNLAQALFDHYGDHENARRYLEDSLSLAVSENDPGAARINFELLQLYKNTNVSVDERIKLLESHIGLTASRDDCYLEYIILLTMAGKYDLARELLGKKRFNIYEGGEGKLTRHHGWLHVLMGLRAEAAGETEAALGFYRSALVYPANYGEGRHYSAQEANIFYYTGLLYEKLGDGKSAAAAFNSGADQPPQESEMTIYAALCMRKLGQDDRADEVLRGMIKSGENLIENADLRGYFGVGSPVPAPYEQDQERLHRIDGLLLIALGKKGLGDEDGAKAALDELLAIDPYNMKVCFLEICGVI